MGLSSAIRKLVQKNASGKEEKLAESVAPIEMLPAKKQVKNYLGFEQMAEDGTCRVEGDLYSDLFTYTDIPYQDMLYEQQKATFSQYMEFLNSVDPSIGMQILLTNQELEQDAVRDIMLLKMEESPEYPRDNEYRKEINDMIETEVALSGKAMIRRRYIALTCSANDREEARAILGRVGEGAIRKFSDFNSELKRLDGKTRLQACATVLNPELEYEPERYSYDQMRALDALESKDLIAPYCLDKVSSDVMKVGNNYSTVLAVTAYPRTTKDEILAEFLRLNINFAISIHYKSLDQVDAIGLVDGQLRDMNSEATRMRRKNSSKFFFTDEMLPSTLQDGIKNATLLHKDLMENEQRLIRQTMLFYTYAPTLEGLEHNIEEIKRIGKMYQYKIEPLNNLQRSVALQAVLPLGRNRVPVERTMLSANAAAFIPFLNETIIEPGGAYYGVDPTLKTPIIMKRTDLDTPNGVILGRSGKGKSFAAKEEITNTLLSDKEASVDVIDIEREFSALATGFDGEVIHISSNSGVHLNPFDINDNYSDNDDPLKVKTEEIIGIVNEMARGLSAMQESLIDRVCQIIYQTFFESEKPEDIPTFVEFNEELRRQPEGEAAMLATTIERYVTGSMSIFAHRTNVDVTKRLRIWDIRDLGKSMRTIGIIIITGQIWNRATKNREEGIRSYFYTDEWQLILKNTYALNFYDELYTRARKWGIVPTIITQNIQRVLKNDTARLILANCDFMLIVSQSYEDALALKELLNLSDSQIKQIRSERKGYGLLVAGNRIVSFSNTFKEDTELYRMFSTKFSEIKKLA